ncbi:MAG: hypothetical protein ACRC33_12555 [Gemmataceae bacterium]
MSSDVMTGPEIVGGRIAVYNLLPYFLDPRSTEADICRLYGLTPAEVAAARAFVLNNPETVLAQHLKIEERIAAGNPPEVIERAERTKAAFAGFKRWLADRQQSAASSNGSAFPTFREWLAEQPSAPGEWA